MYHRNSRFWGLDIMDRKQENLSETAFQRGFSLLCPFCFGRLERKSCCVCDCGRFIVSIGSVCPGRFGKGEKFFEKFLHLSIPSRTKTKKQRGYLCLVSVMMIL